MMWWKQTCTGDYRTWEHLGHIDLKGLHKGIINCLLWLGCSEIPALQWWVLVFNFPLTQKSEKECFKSGEKTTTFFSVMLKPLFALKKTKKNCFSLSRIWFLKLFVLRNVLIDLIYLNANTFWDVFSFEWTSGVLHPTSEAEKEEPHCFCQLFL